MALQTDLSTRRIPPGEPTSGFAWDDRVETWEQVAGSPVFGRLAEAVVEHAAPAGDDRVVDLGAGTGLLTLALAPRVEHVVAVDASRAMLARLNEHARRAELGNVTPLLADLRSLPLADETATLVVSNYAFHHLDDRSKELALSEARRVLAPGGRLVVCDMMFTLSLAARDRAIIASKVRLLARRGPAGLVRIARNVYRILRGRWEQPAPPERWQRMLHDRHFSAVELELLEAEAGIVVARRPEREP